MNQLIKLLQNPEALYIALKERTDIESAKKMRDNFETVLAKWEQDLEQERELQSKMSDILTLLEKENISPKDLVRFMTNRA